MTADLPLNAIAIVGMSGRFPGAASPRELWANVKAGRDAIRHFREDELTDAFPDEARRSESYVKARPIVDNSDLFDAEFFGMYAREAALTDPQHRIFLECAWEALEDAGHDPAQYKGAIGVFAGCSMNTYFLHNVCADRSVIEQFTSGFQVENYSMLTGAGFDFLATRTAYKLDLKGPAIAMATACSTSLMAVAQACQSLLLYQSDMALAGGVSISFPQERGYMHQEGGMVSPDGRCRPFDAKAGGTVFGSGCAVVLLKRLEDAIEDRDQIYALIRSTAVNNDGAAKVGFAAPSVDGQASVIATAHAIAEVSARSIGYVEAHGTATPLGDPIEFAGLVKGFGETTGDTQFCVLGSTKANVGHLDAAAGATGLIRAALSLREDFIPPLLHYETPNPALNIGQSPFLISKTPVAWAPGTEPRRAGVSSFGVGGTNVHAVLEEAPKLPQEAMAEGPYVLPVSARSAADLAAARGRLADYLASNDVSIADAAFTLQAGRRTFDWRSAVACDGREDAIARLRAPITATAAPQSEPPVIFMFPGQGSQYPGMARDLYNSEPVFRQHLDAGAEILKVALGEDIRELLYGGAPVADDNAPHPIRSTIHAQPAIFLIESALARLWISRGVKPAAMMGHSVGELAAACISGVISFEDAVKAVAARAQLMQSMPGGAMLGVRAAEDVLRPLLPPEASIAAINAPSLSVVSGPYEVIEAFEALLTAKGVMHRRLHTSHAFHSAMMEPMVAAFEAKLSGIKLNAPEIPFISCVTGDWITAAQATSSNYWARHARETVRFSDALRTAANAQSKPVLLEVGPGRTLSTFALQTLPKGAIQSVIASLPDASQMAGGGLAFLEAYGELWAAGVKMDWASLHMPGARRISLPTYPFNRKRHWIDAPVAQRSGAIQQQKSSAVDTPAAPGREPAILSPIMILEEKMDTFSASSQPAPNTESNSDVLTNELTGVLEGLSGESIAGSDPAATFLELGFDSLFLAQFATQVQKNYGVRVTFRQLLSDIPSIAALAAHLSANAAPGRLPSAKPAAPAIATAPMAPTVNSITAGTGDMQELFRAQMLAMQTLFEQQQRLLQGGSAPQSVSAQAQAAAAPATIAVPESAETPSRFQVYRANSGGQASGLTPEQKMFIDDLVTRANAKTPSAKRATQENRRHLADPRTASGFRLEWKELIYPIVAARSKGSKIWDLDGNEYVDLVNGYGQTAFGHAPDFVTEAVTHQLQQGFAIGPQSPLAGEVAGLFSEMTGNERVTFCNTGSEAVMAAMRVARTVTGRDKVVVFAGAYHGQFDEVLVRPGGRSAGPRALPVAPGIPNDSVSNMVVLPYATPESLEWVRQNIDDLAAVIIEPVQSRHPELQPKQFAAELRAITEANETALVFDEVVTGFRVHPGGMQELWNIRADMATYGKVVGGGMPIGVLAGKPRFMDALDGGFWQFGDESVPEVAPTFFAGTFVRHPLVLAAARAVLLHLKQHGASLQTGLAERTAALVARLNASLEKRGVQTRVHGFSSWFYFNFGAEDRLSSLLFQHMRLLGVNTQEGFPCFLTTTHTDADIELILSAFDQTLDALQSVGIMAPKSETAAERNTVSAAVPTAAAQPEAPLGSTCPLTEGQREIWLAAQLGDEASCAFNESISVIFNGDLDQNALRSALNDVIARHDSLRASFGRSGDVMNVAPDLRFDLPVIDIIGSDGDATLKAMIDADARKPFDLANGPLIRAQLNRLTSSKHVLVFTAHHIICDGWSMNVIMDDLAQCYAARKAGQESALDAPLQFRRYAERKAKDATVEKQAERFWLDVYKTPAPVVELPTDRSRPAQKSFAGATYRGAFEADLVRDLKKAGAKHGCTLFATLFAAMQALLGRLSGQNDVVLAVPAAGQNLLEDEVLVGHCVNFLPMRSAFDPDAPFSDHLRAVKQHLLEGFDHQDYTFGTLVRQLGLPRDFSRTPLTDVQFNLEKLGSKTAFSGLEVEISPNPKAFTNFDLFINMIESDAGIRIDVDYSTDLYDEATIARWIDHLRTLLKSIAADATQKTGDLEILDPSQREWLINRFNQTEAAFPAQKRVDELVSESARRAPSAVALRSDGRSLTYADLEAKAASFASLLAEQGALSGQRVAVAMDRSVELVCAMLGIWKAGCAYVPLDPTHPPLRLTQTMAEANISFILCDSDAVEALAPPQAKVIRVDRLDPNAIPTAPVASHATGDATAYVIFTSGSTGVPKGVEISHRSLVNLLAGMRDRVGFRETDRLLAVTTVSFDIAALELFLPLVCAGRVIVSSKDDVTDPFRLAALVGSEGVTVLQATPSLWRILLEANLRVPAGFKMLCGGEAMPRDLALKLLATGAELWNVYGPTETTVWSSAGRVTSDAYPIVIGEPIANTQLYVLDDRRKLSPPGVAGELYIGGEGLAKGYFNRPDLTEAAFAPVILDGAPQRLYKTGDKARRLPDGGIQVLGRKDHQIKLRGFRIELEEIEAVLRNAPGVADCAVALRTLDGEIKLACFYTEKAGGKCDVAELSSHVAQRLPSYMIPSVWRSVDALPQTANGKLNRAALEAIEVSNAISRSIRKPQTAMEVKLAAIWTDVLKVEEIGLDDNIFALGADSLQIFRIAARMMDQGVDLQAKHLLRHPTIAELAQMAAPDNLKPSKEPSLSDYRRGAKRWNT